jgi:4-hydroxy-tetrahydrodipicolinate reductase
VIRLVLVGAAGRMGRAIAETAATDPGFHIQACVDLSTPAATEGPPWGEDLAAFAVPGVVVVDFSSPAGAVAAARICSARGAGLVSGTTGLTTEQESEVRAAASRVAVLRAANFSLGLLALRRALRAALPGLPEWDVEIVERHHRGKADSPSGTALHLAREVAALRGWPDTALRHGRQGRAGARPEVEIGVHALRGGTWVGDHDVILAGRGESLELRHVVEQRAAFAHGALAAARFVANATPGLYTLDDVLSAAAC